MVNRATVQSGTPIEKLQFLQDYAGERMTEGLSEEQIGRFLNLDPRLGQAIDEAIQIHASLTKELDSILTASEADQIATLQEGFVNFYTPETINPYVPLAARGPWIVTTCGAVVHDNGGYGMLGLGHAPPSIIADLAFPHVMANIMTASYMQKKFIDHMRAEIGHSRSGAHKQTFTEFVCMNSGSEAMTVAERIADINALKQLAKGGTNEGRKVMRLALKGGFHGRTDRPARISDSSLGTYRKVLHSFKDADDLYVVEPNNVADLEKAFAWAKDNNAWFELMAMEPVMGEGNPGVGVTREFYDRARELTRSTGTLFIIDSIQASLRTQGCLSIVDYPGFEDCDAPDMETYSKALNAGQYPLSVLALRPEIAKIYVSGVYGNTMTTNPRALEAACQVLAQVDKPFRENVRERGKEFVDKLKALQNEFPQVITDVQGTGLLVAASIDPAKFKVVGRNCLEEKMRRRGIGVIHGGENALRFTPHFHIKSEEIDLVIEVLRDIISES